MAVNSLLGSGQEPIQHVRVRTCPCDIRSYAPTNLLQELWVTPGGVPDRNVHAVKACYFLRL